MEAFLWVFHMGMKRRINDKAMFVEQLVLPKHIRRTNLEERRSFTRNPALF